MRVVAIFFCCALPLVILGAAQEPGQEPKAGPEPKQQPKPFQLVLAQAQEPKQQPAKEPPPLAEAAQAGQAGQPEPVLSPGQMAVAAAADCAKQPALSQRYTRYLTLHNIPAKKRAVAFAVLSGHVQHLSTASDLPPLALVPESGGALVRIHTLDYGLLFAEQFELLAEEDPYYHAGLTETVPGAVKQVKKIWPGGKWTDGKEYPKGYEFTETVTEKATAAKRALAPILSETAESKTALAALVALTQSQVPILRADWFFNHTAIAVDRRTNYYTFLGIKAEKDFQRLGGFDKKLAEPFVELRDSIAISGVTLQPRAIARRPALGGALWQSFDFKSAKDKNDPLRIIGADIEKGHDASEQYILMPNGFWATGAFDGKGEAQATVPDSIASDHASKSQDRRIHPNLCMRCHQGGLQPLAGAWFRDLAKQGATLHFPVLEEAIRYRQQYLRSLEPFLARDQEIFLASMKEATGFKTAAEYATAYGGFWEQYEDGLVDLAWAARDLGTSTKELRAAFLAQFPEPDQVGKQPLQASDLVLFALLKGRSIGVRQWEQSNQLAYVALRQHKGK